MCYWIKANYQTLISISSFIIALCSFFFTICWSIKSHRKEKNKLFSDLINEYSSKEMYEAINKITSLSRSCYGKIDFNNLTKEHVDKWIEKFRKQTKNIKNDNNYYVINGYRRLISNYFVKIKILLDKGLISKFLVKRFWREEALSFLATTIIPIEYIAIQTENKKDNSKKELVELYKNTLKYYLPEFFYN